MPEHLGMATGQETIPETGQWTQQPSLCPASQPLSTRVQRDAQDPCTPGPWDTPSPTAFPTAASAVTSSTSKLQTEDTNGLK